MSNIPPQNPNDPNRRPVDPNDPNARPLDPNDPHNDGVYEEEYYERGKTPIHKQPLFWIALIAGAAALLALGFLLGDDDGNSTGETTSVVQVIDETTEVVTPEEEAVDPATETATVTNEVRETVVEQQPAPAPAGGDANADDEAARLNEEALNEANNLLADEPYSKQGLFDRLTSQEGGAHSQEAAQHAVDNIGADWNEEALRAAEELRAEDPEISADEIFNQLTDNNEWDFTDEEAQFAVDRIG